jgi:hypothetical protein
MLLCQLQKIFAGQFLTVQAKQCPHIILKHLVKADILGPVDDFTSCTAVFPLWRPWNRWPLVSFSTTPQSYTLECPCHLNYVNCHFNTENLLELLNSVFIFSTHVFYTSGEVLKNALVFKVATAP